MVDHSPVTLAPTIDSGNELQGGHNFEPQSAAAGTESPTDLCTHDRTRLRPGSASIFQNIMLYDVVCKYEVGLREYLRRRPELWESVMFFDHHNKRTLGDVVRIHEPTPDEPTRFDIEESIPGSKDEVRLYSHVNCNRVERRRKYLACDPDWLAYAARTTGSEENEIPLRIRLMAQEIERMPSTSDLREVTAYKSSGSPVTFPIVPVSWRRTSG